MALTKPQGNMLMKDAGATATTSGTSVTLSGIPAGTSLIFLNLAGVSTNGASILGLRLGDAGGIETSGYASLGVNISAGPILTFGNAATAGLLGLVGTTGAGSVTMSGLVVLALVDAAHNTWAMQAVLARGDAAETIFAGGGYKSTSAALTQIQLLTSGGDTFDAGSVSLSYF